MHGSYLDKYINIALGPPRQKFLTPPLDMMNLGTSCECPMNDPLV